MDGKTSRAFKMERGVKQGDSLSPLLFVIFMDEIIKTCKSRTEKSVVGFWKMKPVYCQALIYADDILLISDTKIKLQKAIIEWTETLKERGMTVNTKKSKVMMVARTEEQIEPIRMECDGEVLEQVDSYQYLGITIHETGKIQMEIRNRIKKTTAAYFSISNTLFGKKEIEKKTKTRVYQAILEPILLYGSESWTNTESDSSRISAVQMKCLRRIAGKTRWDRIRNERIRKELHQEPVMKRVENRQLAWYGHIRRMKETRKVRQFLEAKPQGRRTKGRPRKTWEETVTQIAGKRGKTLNEIRRLAEDRMSYSKWIRGNPLTLHRWQEEGS